MDVLKKTLYGELIRKRYFLSNPETIRHKYVVIGFVMMFIGVFVLMFLAPYSAGKDIVAGILMGLPIIAFARFMPAKTKAGASAYMDILGFQEFMNRAEKDRLERMGDKDLFSKFLPYAIALDVADHWAKAFEGIYQNPPDWYVAPGGFQNFQPLRVFPFHECRHLKPFFCDVLLAERKWYWGRGRWWRLWRGRFLWRRVRRWRRRKLVDREDELLNPTAFT